MASKGQVAHAAFQALMAINEARSAKPLPSNRGSHARRPSALKTLQTMAKTAALLKSQGAMQPQGSNPFQDAPTQTADGLLALLKQGPQTSPNGMV